MSRPLPAILLIALVLLPGVSLGDPDSDAPAAGGLAHRGRFEGRWTVTGRLQLLPFAEGRQVFVVRHRGELFFTRRGGLPRAWSSECLGFGERGALAEGRCVFSDDDGDRVYAEIASVGLEAGRPVRGKLVGGTGKYRGITGELSSPGWRYAARVAEEGQVQAFMDELSGQWSLP